LPTDEPLSALDRIPGKRVGSPFMPEGGRGTVTRNKGDLVAKPEKLVTNAANQVFLVAFGEIGASDGTLE
jgi:hypothetical protein